MSQEALGALVGIQKSGVHKVEAELVNVSVTSLSKYARALQCDESWLLSGKTKLETTEQKYNAVVKQLAELGYKPGEKIDQKEVKLLKTFRETPHNVIIRSDYIATKLWCREDVKTALRDRRYRGTNAEIDAVVNTGYLNGLEDCNDIDWNIIDEALDEAGFTIKE